jgi:hypothetical protein
VRVMLNAGASVQISDDYGRTPLHDCCWSTEPSFDVVDLLLRQDNRLILMKDCRGSTPFAYIRKESRGAWLEFLARNSETYWPKCVCGFASSELVEAEPNTRPMADPPNALSVSLASMVASGKLSPAEAKLLHIQQDESDSDDDDDDKDDESGSGSDNSDESDDDDDEQEELSDLLKIIMTSQNSLPAGSGHRRFV